MLNQFIAWARKVSKTPPRNVSVELTIGQAADNASARLDFESAAAFGRITFWDSGYFHAEAVAAGSDQDLFSLHGQFTTIGSFAAQLSEFLGMFDIPAVPNPA